MMDADAVSDEALSRTWGIETPRFFEPKTVRWAEHFMAP
jgi:hypothetical protein